MIEAFYNFVGQDVNRYFYKIKRGGDVISQDIKEKR